MSEFRFASGDNGIGHSNEVDGMDDDYTPKTCPACGLDLEWEDCPGCGGAGTYHDCGEDCCPCAAPDEDCRVECPECQGEGRVRAHDCPRMKGGMDG